MSPEFVPGWSASSRPSTATGGRGIVLRRATIRDRDGGEHAGFWVVLTSRGEQKTVNRAFLEAVL